MVARIVGACIKGVEAQVVFVEADVSPGLPAFDIVGLAERSVREARERVRAAVRNVGEEFPARRVTVNLAPAALAKEGAALDLPIALGVLAAAGRLRVPGGHPTCALGELGLEGEVRPVRGALPMVVALAREGFERPIVPLGNLEELGLLDQVCPVGVRHLRNALAALRGGADRPGEARGRWGDGRLETGCDRDGAEVPPGTLGAGGAAQEGEAPGAGSCCHPDLSDVLGQETAKRALMIAAAGGHHVLMVGPPGCGKTMLARRLPGIMPPLDPWEAVEVLSIYSAAGERLPWTRQSADGAGRVVPDRPFRAPHHSSSAVGLLGGAGPSGRPGEMSLAHKGVLFMDEFGEFNRSVIEALRQPIEEGSLRVARAAGAVTYPAEFVLVAASNPCRCGFLGDGGRPCRCGRSELAKYRSRLAGPVIDRIDIHLELRRVSLSGLAAGASRVARGPAGVGAAAESPRAREQVIEARERQRNRATSLSGPGSGDASPSALAAPPRGRPGRMTALQATAGGPSYLNGRLTGLDLHRGAGMSGSAAVLLREASERLQLTARSFSSVMRVARTIADLARSDVVGDDHVAEALSLRAMSP